MWNVGVTLYTYDAILFTENPNVFRNMFSRFYDVRESIDLKMNGSENKVFVFGRKNGVSDFKLYINNEKLAWVNKC